MDQVLGREIVPDAPPAGAKAASAGSNGIEARLLRGLGEAFDARCESRGSDADANGYLHSAGPSASRTIYDAVAEEVAALAAPSRDDWMLDLGCGTGALLERLAPLVGRARGIDISAAAVRAAAARGLAADHYAGGILPYAADSFTLVLAVNVLINLPLRALALGLVGEALRVLAPGGRAVFAYCPSPFGSGFRPAPARAGPGARLRILRRRWLGRVAAHAVAFDLAGELMARRPSFEARFVPAQACALPGGGPVTGRYHMILRDLRAGGS